MRKSGFFVLALLLLGILAEGVLASSDDKEVQENEYWVQWDGSANVTLKTIFYGPEDMLNKTKESILQMGLENATRIFVSQEQQKLAQLGLSLENATAEIFGYNTTGPLITIVRGRIPNFARYYSYDNSWEIALDALRATDLSRIDPTAVNGSMYLENYFTVHLPPGARVENVTRGFETESNGSYVKLEVKTEGDTVKVHSVIYLKRGVTRDDLRVLYAKLEPVMIKYSGRAGVENYTVWEMRIYNNITIEGEKTILDTVEEYVRPEEYINYIKVQFLYQGIQRTEQMLYQKYAQAFQSRGIKVISGNVSVLNLNSTGPLIVKYHWVLQGFVSRVNDTYVYTYDPKLELGNMSFPYRLNAAINETKVTRIKLPEGYAFVSLPDDIEVKTKAGSVVMKVKKLSDREVLIESNVYIRYGVPADAYRALMAQVPDNVEFRYVVKAEEGKGICGPVLMVGLALLPLIWRRR